MKKIYQDSTFYLVIFIISYFIYVYPFEIINVLIFNENSSKYSSIYYTLIVGSLMILYFRSNIKISPLKIFVYEGLGIGFISFWVLNISLIINYFLPNYSFKIGLISLFIIFFISIYSILNAYYIQFKEIKITSKKIKKNYNIIFISDIHLGSNSIKHLKRILFKISNIKYDFILIGGDLIDSNSFKIEDLFILKEIKKPIYFVTGNHEFYIDNYKEKLKLLENFNIKILDNKKEIFEEINIIGIADNLENDKKIKINNNLILPNNFNLTLIHKPSIWNQIKHNSDLMISGHTHNGQIFPFNFFVYLKFKYKFGLYKFNNSYLYVSSGSGCWGPRMRLGTKNEIINLRILSD